MKYGGSLYPPGCDKRYITSNQEEVATLRRHKHAVTVKLRAIGYSRTRNAIDVVRFNTHPRVHILVMLIHIAQRKKAPFTMRFVIDKYRLWLTKTVVSVQSARMRTEHQRQRTSYCCCGASVYFSIFTG